MGVADIGFERVVCAVSRVFCANRGSPRTAVGWSFVSVGKRIIGCRYEFAALYGSASFCAGRVLVRSVGAYVCRIEIAKETFVRNHIYHSIIA